MAKRTVGVRFIDSQRHGVAGQVFNYNDGSARSTQLSYKVYHYFTPVKIEVGDLLVVQVGTEFKVVMAVESSTKHCSPYANKWIVGKVNEWDCWGERCMIIEREELEAKMQEYYERQTRYSRWEKLLRRDKKFRKMYKRWCKLSDGELVL